MKPELRIETLEDSSILYIRFRGTYLAFRRNARKLFTELYTFADAHQLIRPDVTKVLTIYNDNPYISAPEQLRTSVAMTIPAGITHLPDSESISATTLNGRYAVARFDLRPKDYGEAWTWVYQEWLFKSEYTLRDAPPFELYVNEPPATSKGSSITDFYIPIE